MDTKSTHRVIAIVGPTASGKSGLAIALAKKLNGEIISADSRQVYKGLNIGTGKVTKKEMSGIPHHLLDIVHPRKQISVEVWKKNAEQVIADIHQRERVAIVCGGTGLYVDSLLRGHSFPEVPPNVKLRRVLEKKSSPELFAILKKIDPRRASAIDQHNPRRLIRAIEIVKALGKVPPRAALGQKQPPYSVVWVGVNPSDIVLKKRIHVRLLARMKQGMVRETQRLHSAGLSHKRMRELGLEYRFLADFLEKKLTKKEMIAQLEQAIWQYAKRQRTWWKKYTDIHWLTEPSISKALKFL